MKRKMICIGIISTLLFAGLISLSAVAKEELNTDPLNEQYTLSIRGGTRVAVHIKNIDSEEHELKIKFEVWKYNNHDGYEVLVREDECTQKLISGARLTCNYMSYRQILNGRVDIKIYMDDNLIAESYGDFFYIFTWGYTFHH